MTLGQLLELLGSWQEDPCWDLEGTDGLTPAQVLLVADFAHHCEQLWSAESRITHQQQHLRQLQEALDHERGLLALAMVGLREHREAAKEARKALLDAAELEPDEGAGMAGDTRLDSVPPISTGLHGRGRDEGP